MLQQEEEYRLKLKEMNKNPFFRMSREELYEAGIVYMACIPCVIYYIYIYYHNNRESFIVISSHMFPYSTLLILMYV